MYRESIEAEIDEREEGESQEVIDDLESEIFDLTGQDEKIVRDILKAAELHFDEKPSEWSKILNDVIKSIHKNRKGEFEDEELFTAELHDKQIESNDLIEH